MELSSSLGPICIVEPKASSVHCLWDGIMSIWRQTSFFLVFRNSAQITMAGIPSPNLFPCPIFLHYKAILGSQSYMVILFSMGLKGTAMKCKEVRIPWFWHWNHKLFIYSSNHFILKTNTSELESRSKNSDFSFQTMDTEIFKGNRGEFSPCLVILIPRKPLGLEWKYRIAPMANSQVYPWCKAIIFLAMVSFKKPNWMCYYIVSNYK